MTQEATTVDLDNVVTNFTNITEEPPKDINRTEFIVLTSIVAPLTFFGNLLILICLVAPLSFFGNLLILICFVKEKKLRFFGNYFVISLATTDMISGVVVAGKNSNFITSGIRPVNPFGSQYGSQTSFTYLPFHAAVKLRMLRMISGVVVAGKNSNFIA